MQTKITLKNSNEHYLTEDEVFLRSIPAKISVGKLNTDALRLLVYYVSKASPYELAVESGNFEGTLSEWLQSLQANLSFAAIVETYADLDTVKDELSLGDLVFVKFNGKLYPFDGEGFAAEEEGLDIKGMSAYQIAVLTGFVGTEEEWVASLKGIDGLDGASAYEVAVLAGYVGDEASWLETLKGDEGPQGEAGEQGLQGVTGEKGEQGAPGLKGTDGQSAYALAVSEGFTGTEAEWLESLKGEKGDTGSAGADGAKGDKGDDGTPGLKGDTGDTGSEGPKGEKGDPGEKGADGTTPTITDLLLTGLDITDATAVTDADNILIAIGKLQAQIDALVAP